MNFLISMCNYLKKTNYPFLIISITNVKTKNNLSSSSRYSIRHYLLTVFFISFSLILNAQLNSDGWTTLDPNNADSIIYVSTSGDDTTAIVYQTSSPEIGNDPILPTGNIKPYKTIEAAVSNLKDGDATWVLLKRGDTFYESIKIEKSGQSVNRPIVYSSYGTANQPPLFKTKKNSETNRDFGLRYCCRSIANIWVIGLSFYDYTHNPKDTANFNPDATGGTGFYLFSGDNHKMENILIEGCNFRFYGGNVIQGTGLIHKIKIRRNVITDNYGTTSHSQGFFTSNVQGMLLEENIFDHNGWYKQSILADNDKEGGQATIFNHNTYFNSSKNVTFTGNSFHRPSSIGTKWTSNKADDQAKNITITNNLYDDCEVGISIGGNKKNRPYRFKDINITGNIISSSGLSQQTNRTLAWGVTIENWDTGVYNKNLMIHQNNENITNGIAVTIYGDNKNMTLDSNIFYNLGTSTGISIRKDRTDFPNNLDNIKITNNKMDLPLSSGRYLINIHENKGGVSFKNNSFKSAGNPTQLFRVDNRRMTFEDWSNEINNEGSDITTSFNFPNPERTLDMYITDVLSLTGKGEFYTELRKQSILNWRTEYTAIAINEWIKKGFEQETLSIEDLESTTLDQFKLIPNPGNGIFKVEGISNATEGDFIVFSIAGKTITKGKINNNLSANLSDLASGIYLIKFIDKDFKTFATKKYVKK